MSNLENLVESLSKLTVMEAAELSKKLEETWGVSAAPVAAVAAPGAAAPADDGVAAKTDFDVNLVSIDASKKLNVIKEVRALIGLGLKEAKEFVEGAPKVVKAGVPKEEAEKMQKSLEAAGAKIELK